MKRNNHLSDKIVDRIREMILNNKIATGETLNEIDLSQEFGVSRTPIREAISVLEQEGLIKIVAGKGAFVTELTISDYQEINELRAYLEPMAAVKSMDEISDAEIDEQIKIWRKLGEGVKEGRTYSNKEMAEFDQNLHKLLIDRCHNNRLSSFLWILRHQSIRYIFAVWQGADYYTANLDEHLKILQALKSRDKKHLELLIQEHVIINNRNLYANTQKIIIPF